MSLAGFCPSVPNVKKAGNDVASASGDVIERRGRAKDTVLMKINVKKG